jgi:hypothetical protein
MAFKFNPLTGQFDLVGGGGGGIESIVADDGIEIDNTDPANPIISVKILPPLDIDASNNLVITEAATDKDGYLSMSSFQVFNNKQDALPLSNPGELLTYDASGLIAVTPGSKGQILMTNDSGDPDYTPFVEWTEMPQYSYQSTVIYDGDVTLDWGIRNVFLRARSDLNGNFTVTIPSFGASPSPWIGGEIVTFTLLDDSDSTVTIQSDSVSLINGEDSIELSFPNSSITIASYWDNPTSTGFWQIT